MYLKVSICTASYHLLNYRVTSRLWVKALFMLF